MQIAQASTYQPRRWFENKKLLLGAAVVVGLSFLMTTLLGLSIPLSLALAAQIVLFALLFHRPIWAMASLMVGQLTASGYMLTLTPEVDLSVRFLWTIMTVLLLVPILKNQGGIELGTSAKRILIPTIILFFWATIANAVHTDLSYTLEYSRIAATALVILILLPATVKNEKDIKLLALVALITCSVSAIFALIQLWGSAIIPAYTLYGRYTGYRVSGLSESAVHLGFNLPMILLPMVSIYFVKGVSPSVRKLLILLAILLSTALYFTYTRSGIYSLVPGLLFMILLLKGKPKKELLLVILILFTAFFFFVEAEENRYTQSFEDDPSAAGRLVLWQAGVYVAMDNPILGIGHETFQEASLEYIPSLDPDLMETQGAGRAIGAYEVHNDFINVWASFGLPALLAFLWLFVGIFLNFLDTYRHSRTRFLKGLSLGCCGALAAYSVNAATHNVMDSSMLLWILGGLSIAATKLALSEQPSRVNEIQ